MVICITGMRSGSSMVARLLSLCGLYLGPEADLMPAAEYDNPEGYWENLRFVALNDLILDELHAAWDNPPPLRLGWWRAPQFASQKHAAEELIAEFEGHRPWGWKDPRNSLTLEFWRDLLPDLKLVICLRHPWEVAVSLSKNPLTPKPFEIGLNLWLRYHEQLLNARGQAIVTHFESYFYDPRAELHRIADFAGLNPSETVVEEAIGTISRSLRRNVRNKLPGAHELPNKISELYGVLCAEAGPVYAQANSGLASAPEATLNTVEDAQNPPYAVALKTELDNLRQEQQKSVVYIHTLEAQLALARSEALQAAEYIGKLETELNNMRRIHAEAAQYIQRLESLVEGYRQNTNEASEYVQRLETQITNLQAELDALKAHVERQGEAWREASEYARSLEVKVQDLHEHLQQYQAP